MKVLSPLTNKESVRIDSIPSITLIQRYDHVYNIDVSKYFKAHKTINIYKCPDSEYRFYYPFDISGDGKFYEALQEIDWYYMPWKWEHDQTLKLLSGQERILEVGSGGLGFVERMQDIGYDIIGLELNKESIDKAKEMNLKVFQEDVQSFAVSNEEKFDICCTFQVLEHISDVNSFIKAQIDCLKPGGKLIISVPNNETFLKYKRGGLLNMPPHHMGLWDTSSLKAVARIFNLDIVKIRYEPLQKYHVDWYLEIVVEKRLKSNPLLDNLYKKLKLKGIIKSIILLLRKLIHGHTIMVVYKKI